MSFKTMAIGATLGTTAFATNAIAAVYECKVGSNGQYGGIPPVMVFTISDDEDAIFVYDGMIKELYDQPLKEAIVVANAKRYTFKWTVDTVVASDGETIPSISYRATYHKRNHKIKISGFPAGWDNQYNGTGTCKGTK